MVVCGVLILLVEVVALIGLYRPLASPRSLGGGMIWEVLLLVFLVLDGIILIKIKMAL